MIVQALEDMMVTAVKHNRTAIYVAYEMSLATQSYCVPKEGSVEYINAPDSFGWQKIPGGRNTCEQLP